MKLILTDNMILLKVSPDALERFRRDNAVESAVVFGKFAGDRLIFSLETSHSYINLHVSMVADRLRIYVPKNLAVDWAWGDRMEFGTRIDVGHGRELILRIEKDMPKAPSQDMAPPSEEVFPREDLGMEPLRKQFPYD
ncbi:MAG: hypothetical protein OHK0039_19730 [Bacteroidia bacterium]